MAGLRRRCGRVLLATAPLMMKVLSVVGTAAMFLVGGGILMHGLPGAHDLVHAVSHVAEAVPGVGGLLAATMPTLIDALGGIVAGAIVLAAVSAGQKLLGLFKRA